MSKDLAVWVRKTKNNETYLSIKIGDENFVAFKNKFKGENTLRPDYVSPKDQNTPQKPQNAPQTPDNTLNPTQTPENDTTADIDEANAQAQIIANEEQ